MKSYLVYTLILAASLALASDDDKLLRDERTYARLLDDGKKPDTVQAIQLYDKIVAKTCAADDYSFRAHLKESIGDLESAKWDISMAITIRECEDAYRVANSIMTASKHPNQAGSEFSIRHDIPNECLFISSNNYPHQAIIARETIPHTVTFLDANGDVMIIAQTDSNYYATNIIFRAYNGTMSKAYSRELKQHEFTNCAVQVYLSTLKTEAITNSEGIYLLPAGVFSWTDYNGAAWH